MINYFKKLVQTAYLQVRDVFKNKGIVDGNLSSNFFIHCIDVRLINCHAFFCQRRRIINRDIVQLRMLTPIFICRNPKRNIAELNTNNRVKFPINLIKSKHFLYWHTKSKFKLQVEWKFLFIVLCTNIPQ